MGLKRVEAKLKKEAFIEQFAGAVGGHVLQNIAASKMLLNGKGGTALAREVVSPGGKRGFFDGLKSAVVPERAILKDHIAEAAREIPKLSTRERVALYHLSQGNMQRVIDSGIIEKSPNIKSLLAKHNIPIDDIVAAKKVIPKEMYSKLIAEHEDLYRNSATGKFISGVGKGLKDVPVKNLSNIAPSMSKGEAAGEIAGNIAIGIKEPLLPGLNAVKRLGADKAVPDTIKSRFQETSMNRLVKPVFSRADKLAEQGKTFGPIEGTARKYMVNPITYEAANYKNRAMNLTRNYLGL
jgi:hypothetical protein